MKDLGTKTVQFGIIANWDETNTSALSLTETNFVNGDSYEVVSLPTWPAIQNHSGNVRLQFVDVLGGSTRLNANTGHSVLNMVVCGFITQMVMSSGIEGIRIFSSVFCHPTGTGLLGISHLFSNCAFVSTVLEVDNGGTSWTGQKNLFVASEFRIWHNMIFGSLGEVRCFDATTPCISVRHNSTCRLIGPLSGSGNSGALVNCDTSGILYGAANVSATTSAALPYTVSGTGYATPVVDGGSGDGIYN